MSVVIESRRVSFYLLFICHANMEMLDMVRFLKGLKRKKEDSHESFSIQMKLQFSTLTSFLFVLMMLFIERVIATENRHDSRPLN